MPSKILHITDFEKFYMLNLREYIAECVFLIVGFSGFETLPVRFADNEEFQ